MFLNEIKENNYAKIINIIGEKITRHHLLDMGVIPGAIVQVKKYAPMGDPIEIFIHGYNLTLRLADAQNIEVENINENEKFKIFTKCSSCNNCSNCKNYKNYKKCEDSQDLQLAQNCSTNCPKNNKIKNKLEHPGLGETGKFHNKKNEQKLPHGTLLSFALIGNQNTGKTTLFNQLTGSNQHIGNFPGVTVDKKSGPILKRVNTTITDLPGIYSLSPYSIEEKVSRDFLLNEKPHCIINIVDGNNIERNLNLTLQLLELNIPVVLAINMIDEIYENGGSIDINILEHKLGIPVVPISAVNNSGVDELINHAIHIAKFQEKPKVVDFCDVDDHDGAVHRAIHSIMHLIEDHTQKIGISKRFATTKIIEGDDFILNNLSLSNNEKEMIEHICTQLEEERGLDRVAAIADMRFSFITKICNEAIIKPKENKGLVLSNNIDTILTGKWTGIPIFIAIMGLIFYLTFNVIGNRLQNILSISIDLLSSIIENTMLKANICTPIISLVIDGIFAGVGSVLSFIPIILILFLFLSLLEDSGYMARVAFVMDKLLRKLGLSGRSIVPLIIGFGCTVPAVMSTRTIPSNRDRKLTILLLPFITCTAKLPIYGFFANAFFPHYAGFIMIGLYIFTIIIGIILSLITKNSFFKGEAVPFIMELPNYRFPSPINVIKLLWEKTKDFLQKAFTIIFFATIIIWFLQNFDLTINLVNDTTTSILAHLSGLIAPIFKPMGLNDYRIVTSLISGFLAKESVVSTLTVLYGNKENLMMNISQAGAIALLVFSSLYTPCIAAITTIKKELGTRWAIFIMIFQCLLAYLLSYITYIIFS